MLIPFINHPKSKTQKAPANYTTFQLKSVKAITELAEFAYFVTIDSVVLLDHENLHPTNVLWYDIYGNLHANRIGVKRLLHKVQTGQSTELVGIPQAVIESRTN
jgi:hypothetical protein